MNRFYTKEFALDTIDKIHKSFDLPYIGCDIITGFPNESKNDFLETKEALELSKVSYIHSFPYSKREGTKACSMEGHIPEHVKKERTKELIMLSDKLHNDFLTQNRNKTARILYERKGKNGLYQGVTDNYIKVFKKSEKNIRNTIEIANLSAFKEIY